MEFLSGVPLFAAIITLVLGVGLIVLEICLPGFGVPGISGTILTTFSLLVMVNYIGWGFRVPMLAGSRKKRWSACRSGLFCIRQMAKNRLRYF